MHWIPGYGDMASVPFFWCSGAAGTLPSREEDCAPYGHAPTVGGRRLVSPGRDQARQEHPT